MRRYILRPPPRSVALGMLSINRHYSHVRYTMAGYAESAKVWCTEHAQDCETLATAES